VKEIKLALKKNIKLGLSYENDEKYCKVWLAEILTLINELERENEELEKQCVGWVEIYQKKKEENQQLKDENERLILQYERVKADSEMNCLDLKDRIAELEKEKAEQLRQVGERLKNYIDENQVQTTYFGGKCFIDKETIDKTLKEFIND
jgi:hypothetical protein